MKMLISLGLCLLALVACGCHKKPTQPPPDDPPPAITYPGQFDPAWHPSDTMIIYYTPVPEVNDTLDSYTGLWAIRPDGINNRPYLTKGMNPVYTLPSAPDWSADGEWLVFCTGGYNNIYKVNGDSLTKLTFDGNNICPAWSPNQQKIAFMSMYPSGGSSYGIYQMSSNGSDVFFIKEYYFAPVWLDSLNVLAIKAVPTHNKIFTTAAHPGLIRRARAIMLKPATSLT